MAPAPGRGPVLHPAEVWLKGRGGCQVWGVAASGWQTHSCHFVHQVSRLCPVKRATDTFTTATLEGLSTDRPFVPGITGDPEQGLSARREEPSGCVRHSWGDTRFISSTFSFTGTGVWGMTSYPSDARAHRGGAHRSAVTKAALPQPRQTMGAPPALLLLCQP